MPVDVPVISPSNIANLAPVWELPSDDRIYLADWSPQENRIGIGTGHGIEVRGFPSLGVDQVILDGPYEFAFGHAPGIILVGSEGGVKEWELSSSAPVREFRDPYDWTATATMALAADGDTLASNVGTALVHGVFVVIHIWDVETGRQLLTISEDGVGLSYQLAFPPDGREIASGSRLDGKVHFWDTRTGGLLGQVEGESVTYSPDGGFLATGRRNSVWIWDAVTKALVRELYVARRGA